MRLAFESVDTVKLRALPSVGGTISPWGSWGEQSGEEAGSPLFPASLLELGPLISSSPVLRLGFTSPAPRAQAFRPGLSYTTGFPGTPAWTGDFSASVTM